MVNIEQAITQLQKASYGSYPLEAGCALFKRFFGITTEHISVLYINARLMAGFGAGEAIAAGARTEVCGAHGVMSRGYCTSGLQVY